MLTENLLNRGSGKTYILIGFLGLSMIYFAFLIYGLPHDVLRRMHFIPTTPYSWFNPPRKDDIETRNQIICEPSHQANALGPTWNYLTQATLLKLVEEGWLSGVSGKYIFSLN